MKKRVVSLQHKLDRFLSLFTPIRELFFFLLVVGVIIDILYPSSSDGRLLALIMVWLLIVKLYHFTSTATFKIAFAFLASSFLLFLFARDHVALDRLSTWLYLFLLIGLIQQFRELRTS